MIVNIVLMIDLSVKNNRLSMVTHFNVLICNMVKIVLCISQLGCVVNETVTKRIGRNKRMLAHEIIRPKTN